GASPAAGRFAALEWGCETSPRVILSGAKDRFAHESDPRSLTRTADPILRSAQDDTQWNVRRRAWQRQRAPVRRCYPSTRPDLRTSRRRHRQTKPSGATARLILRHEPTRLPYNAKGTKYDRQASGSRSSYRSVTECD